jgi:hypothetical protein
MKTQMIRHAEFAQFLIGVVTMTMVFIMVGMVFPGAIIGLPLYSLFHSELLRNGLILFGGCLGLIGFIILARPIISETYQETYHPKEHLP